MTRNAFGIMHEPALALLSRHGIQYRVKQDNYGVWYNMRRCPSCGHEGYQCGILEIVRDGKIYHGIKCWHVADNGHGTDTPEYEDFLLQMGELNAEEAHQIKSYIEQQPDFPLRMNGRRGGMKPCPFHTLQKNRNRRKD